MTGAQALVVDDEPDIRDSIADVLELEGYSVVKAENGCRALDLAARTAPSVMLLDLMMPVMSGWEVVEALKRDAHLSAIRVIVVSAAPNPPAGFPVLQKPFDLDDLLAIVRRELDGAAPHHPAA